MDYERGRDRLSELPLSIIHVILALVPIRDAVRTCVLSRQWRYAWANLPHLVFKKDHSIRGHYKSTEEYEDYMENFITHVLALHKGPIHKFKVSVPLTWNCRNIGVWLLWLSRNDIRELIMDMDYSSYSWTQQLHSSIYSCKKLTKLELYKCELDPPPKTFKAFLFLRSLCLQRVFLPSHEVGSLVANCPLLEEFTSIHCNSMVLEISAPNLKVLHLQENYVNMSVYAPLLAELSVELIDYELTADDEQDCNYTDFLGGFTNLEKLSGNDCFRRYLNEGIESCHHTLVFHRLKHIEFDEVYFGDIEDISVIAHLIVGAPNLQKLKISISSPIYNKHASKVPCVSFRDLGCTPNFKLEKLRVVHMRGTTGLPHEMELIKFLLESSPVLEKMVLDRLDRLRAEVKQFFEGGLSGFGRASPNAKLSMTLY